MKNEYIYLIDIDIDYLKSKLPDHTTITKKKLYANKDCYLVTVSVPGDNYDSAKNIALIDTSISEQKYKPYKRLHCGHSEYYLKRLFKKCNLFELKLRELLLLSVVLANEPEKELIDLVKKLDDINFGLLLYSLKYDFTLINSIKHYLEKAHSKDEIVSYIESLEEKENWFVSIGLSDSKLNSNTRVIIDHRNAIMHHHYIDYNRYIAINSDLESVSNDIEDVIKFYKELSSEDYERLVDAFKGMFAGLKRLSDELMESAARLFEFTQSEKFQDYLNLYRNLFIEDSPNEE